VNPKYWDGEETLEELKLRFEYGTRYDSDSLDLILMLANGDYELLHKGLVKYMKSGANDSELNDYIRDHLNGVKAKPKVKDIEVDFNLDPDLNLIFIKQAAKDFDLNEAKDKWNRLLTRVLVSKNSLNTPTRANRMCVSFYN